MNTRVLRLFLFAGFGLLTLGLLFFFPDRAIPLAYLLLVPIVAVSLLDSLRAGVIYAAGFSIGATFLLLRAGQPVALFLLIMLAVSITAWVSAGYWQRSLKDTEKLADELKANAERIQSSNEKLRRSAEVSQVASASLDLNLLLKSSVDLIRNQFGHDHVAIYLVDETGRRAFIRESTGHAGDMLKSRNHYIRSGSKSLIGTTLANGEAQIVADVSKSDLYQYNPLLPDTQAEMVLPLRARGELLGVLDVQSRVIGAFKDEDVAIMQLVANQIGSSIDNARLFSAVQDRLNETEAIYQVTRTLTQTLDVGEIYTHAGEVFAQQLDIARCMILIWDDAERALVTKSVFPGEVEDDQSIYPLEKHPNLREVYQSGRAQVHFIDDPALPAKEKHYLETAGHTQSLLVPVLSGDQAMGIVCLYRNLEQTAFSQSEINIAQAMANQVASAAKNSHLATETRSRAAQLSMLNRISRILSVSDKIVDVFNGARREIFALTRATGMSVMLLTEDNEYMEWAYGFEYGAVVSIPNRILPVSQGLSGYVVRMREPLLITERFEEEKERFQSVTVGTVAAAWLGVPLIVGNQIIGVLVVENGDDPDAFDDRDTQLLTTISGPLAITIENQRLLNQAQERARRQQMLNEISTQLHRSADVETILSIGLRALSEQLPGRDVQVVMEHDQPNPN